MNLQTKTYIQDLQNLRRDAIGKVYKRAHQIHERSSQKHAEPFAIGHGNQASRYVTAQNPRNGRYGIADRESGPGVIRSHVHVVAQVSRRVASTQTHRNTH